MATVFVYCDVEGEPEHHSAIDGLVEGKIDLSRTPCVGESLAIRSAMFEVVRVIHRIFGEVEFDAAVELKPTNG